MEDGCYKTWVWFDGFVGLWGSRVFRGLGIKNKHIGLHLDELADFGALT